MHSVHPTPKFSIGVSLSDGLLNLELDTQELNLRELSNILKSYRQRKKYHRLPDGSFLKLEDNALAAVAEAAGELGGELDGGSADNLHAALPRAVYRQRFKGRRGRAPRREL